MSLAARGRMRPTCAVTSMMNSVSFVWREVGREDGDVAINLGPAGSQHGRLVAHELRIRIISEGTQGRILPPESLISESLGR